MTANSGADQPTEITLTMMREVLSVPLLCDALDSFGLTRQSPRLPIVPVTLPPAWFVNVSAPSSPEKSIEPIEPRFSNTSASAPPLTSIEPIDPWLMNVSAPSSPSSPSLFSW